MSNATKAVVDLTDPEEHIPTTIDAWARMMFERNATKHGMPSVPLRDAARLYPESYMCICAYYALKRRRLIDCTYEEFELRWDGIDLDEGEEVEGLTDPTNPARSAG